jgi:DNA-binding MarR family transcriptional regulator
MTDSAERPAALPALLRAARNAYGKHIRTALAAVDCDDVPRNGIYVIGALARGNVPMAQIIADLAVSKQAAGQLVDTLVLRGYLARTEDPEDRRRLILDLTPRGQAAAAASAKTIDGLEAAVIELLGKEHVAKTREVLWTLIRLGAEAADQAQPQAETAPPASSTRRFERQRLGEAQFRDCAMAGARFDDIDLSAAAFCNVNLAGARLHDVNLQGATISDANIKGLTIAGYDIHALIQAEIARKAMG